MGRDTGMTLDDVNRTWPIVSTILAAIFGLWRWLTAKRAREEARLARMERDIQKGRAEAAERLRDIQMLRDGSTAAWGRIDKLTDDVTDIREGVARIEGAMGTRRA